MEFLKYEIQLRKVRIKQGKIKAIKNWLILISVKEVRIFLRFVNYYKRIIVRFGDIITPLTNLIKKNV